MDENETPKLYDLTAEAWTLDGTPIPTRTWQDETGHWHVETYHWIHPEYVITFSPPWWVRGKWGLITYPILRGLSHLGLFDGFRAEVEEIRKP